MTVIVLRGPAGAGKSTLAEHLREAMKYPCAVVDTDIFSWQCVPGESDKQVVYENVLLVAENYLRHGYSVIVSGLILTAEEDGAIGRLRDLAAALRHVVGDFYCAAPLEVAIDRNAARTKDVPEEHIRLWWQLAGDDRTRIAWTVHELNMERPLDENVAHVLDTVGVAE